MAKGKIVQLVPRGNGSQANREGGTPIATHRTQAAATGAASKVAKQTGGEVVIHRPNGQIRDQDSYGSDPSPSRDTKH